MKGAPCEENETCFLYKGVSYLRVLTVAPHAVGFVVSKKEAHK